MSRRRTDALAVAMLAAALLVAPVVAQPGSAPRDPLEAYLEDRGLDELLATYLRDRLARAAPDERQSIAERLADLYARLHASAATPHDRERIETLGYALLREMPESDSFSLRLNLAKARYLKAEEVAERARLRLANEAERAEALQSLRAVGATFDEISVRVQGVIDALEREEQRAGPQTDIRELRRRLERARRERSLARFYAGWTKYYLATLEGRPNVASNAAADFGWLLGTPGRPAAVERASRNMLRYEHVARAALGSALVASLLGNDAEAERWFDLLQTSPEVPDSVLDQVFSRRMTVYAAARRWADLQRIVALHQQRTGQPLSVADARLLGVLTLEASRDPSAVVGRAELLASLAQIAFRDLIARGDLGQVIDLVNRYGTAPIGAEGFVPEYVRAIKAYDRALEAHRAAGGAPDTPAVAPDVVTLFREAAGLLTQAASAANASEFPQDRDRAAVLSGVALFLAGQFDQSATTLEQAAQVASAPERREEALWLAIASLDKAVESDRPSLASRRDRLATLYLEQFPGTERAARLLIRRAGEGLLPDAKAAEVLLGVPPNSPLYVAARRYASRVLYRMWRAALPDERERAAQRFMQLADELVMPDEQDIAGTDAAVSARVAAEFLVRERQVLDILLAGPSPDLERAVVAIDRVRSAASAAGVKLDEIAPELAYRRLQIALAVNDIDAIRAAGDELRQHGGRFAEAGDRLLYRRALEAWAVAPADHAAAREVVAIGQRLIARLGSTPKSLADPAIFGLHDTVAEAAASVWRATSDDPLRTLAIALDRKVTDAGLANARVLRRRAELTESAGLRAEALDAWRSLLAGHREGTTEWYDARYNSLRLLLDVDPAEARRVFDQYATLHPELGPAPWNERFANLQARLDAATPTRRSDE